jgi:hypothetical protein
VSNIIRRHIENRKLLLICILLLTDSFIFFKFYFYQYMVVLLFNTVIYVFIVRSMYSYCSATLTEVFHVIVPHQDGARPALFHCSFVLFYVLFFCVVLYIVCLFFLCCSVYCLCVNVYCTAATGWQPNCS